MKTFTLMKKGRNEFITIDWWNLLKISIIFSFWFILADIIWTVYQPLFISIWISIEHVWIIFAIGAGLSLIWSWMTKYIYDWKKTPWSIVQLFLCVLSITWMILLLPWYWKLLGLIIVQITFGWYRPVMDVYINHHTGSRQRATVNSIIALI